MRPLHAFCALRRCLCIPPHRLNFLCGVRITGWADDEDKCIFIVLDRGFPDDAPGALGPAGSMAGDVNLFLNDADGAGIAELDVMIADARSRRRGLGRAAVKAMMAFAAARLPAVRGFRVRVNDDNGPSLGLFLSLGFTLESHSEIFKQARIGGRLWRVVAEA